MSICTTGRANYPAEMYIAKLSDGADVASLETRTPAGEALRIASAPNPFRAATQIRYVLPGSGHARVTVFDAAGRHVRDLIDRHESAGAHLVSWDGLDEEGSPVSAGVYAYRLSWKGVRGAGRVLLLK